MRGVAPPRPEEPVPRRLPVIILGLVTVLGAVVAPLATVPRAWSLFVRGEAAAADGESLVVRILIDLALVTVFGLQHSGMVRPAYRRAYGRRFPPATDRATYSLFSGLALALVFAAWRPIGGVAWDATDPRMAGLLGALLVGGWALAAGGSLAIGGLELLGLPQLRDYLAGRSFESPRFRTPRPYHFVRHPIMLGFLVGMWGGPRMTADRLVLVAGMSVYILVGIVLEERDLRAEFGESYARWRARTPMLLPRLGRLPRSHGSGAVRSGSTES